MKSESLRKMLGRNCPSSSSSSSSSSSPSQLNSPRNFENGVLQNILNASPTLSSHSKPIVPLRQTLPHQASNGNGKQKSSEKLRKEIAKLEFEIVYLERYLLSLYRTAFEEQVASFSDVTVTNLQYRMSSPSVNQLCQKLEPYVQNSGFPYQNQASPVYNKPISYSPGFSASLKASSIRERTRSVSGHRSLADLLGASHMVQNIVTPNKLSEEIVRCVSSIYCKLSGCRRTSSGLSGSSPPSSVSSSSIFSSKNPCDSWSPRFEELKEESGSHPTVIQVLKLHLDDDSFNYAALMLQNFRSLVRCLEKVDPRKMKREEKLAFWINIHNALVMHAYLAYGTHNRVRSTSVFKAAYNVGGHCLNAYVIQTSILGIQAHHSAPIQLLQTLFSPGRRLKTCSIKHIYSLEYPEPLVHFALCSGASTDPPVRVYAADSIFQDLRQAKEEFIQTNVHIHKGSKILLPKIIYYYAKDISQDTTRVLEVIAGCLQETERKVVQKCLKERKSSKCIEWLPENSTFRYVILRDLAGGRRKM